MKDCVAAVGTFDGVHIGHQAILARVKELAAGRGLESRVVTFMNHPLTVVAPQRAPLWVVSRDESEFRILREGIDRVSFMNFTAELAALTAREFMRLLHDRYGVRVLVMGHDNTFGSDRLGSREEYVAAGRDEGIEVHFVEAVSLEDGTVASSSAVRHALADGELRRVEMLTKSVPVLTGEVVRGKRNGHKLGFPTMNIDCRGQQMLKEGVYAAFIHLPEDHPLYDEKHGNVVYGVLNIGRNPTIAADNPVTVEFHAPGIDLGDMYGEEMSVLVTARLRDEQRFASLKALKQAINDSIDEMVLYVMEIMADNKDMMDTLHPRTIKEISKRLKRIVRSVDRV